MNNASASANAIANANVNANTNTSGGQNSQQHQQQQQQQPPPPPPPQPPPPLQPHSVMDHLPNSRNPIETNSYIFNHNYNSINCDKNNVNVTSNVSTNTNNCQQ
ncbi:uncharacterized protein DMAD_01101 [Drosophila madeirensis]|uniref:Uncharacterized protein n=1 Tax=Drosophila madeirensis TaxID=30013 RepID=A0AAU9FYT0_DROMD